MKSSEEFPRWNCFVHHDAKEQAVIKRFGFSKTLTLFVIFVSLVGLVSGAFSFMSSKTAMTDLAQTSQKGIGTLNAKSSVLKVFSALHSNVLAILSEKDKDSIELRQEIIKGYFSELSKVLTDCGTDCNSLSDDVKKYEGLWNKISAENITKGDMATATGIALNNMLPIAEALLDKIDKNLSETRKKTTDELDTSISRSEKAQKVLAAIVFGSSIFIFLMGIGFKRQLVNALNAVANHLYENVGHTADMSGKMNSSSEDLSRATERQAAAVQETVAAMDEVNAMVGNNAKTAASSLDSANSTQMAANRGKQTVSQMITVMDDINASNVDLLNFMEVNNKELAQIVKVISEIGDKTKVINDIVFQTRLLSFNASVEAARAGEVGKGFAVVAEEVGKLAQTSGQAAREISGLLESSVQKVESIVQSTRSSVQKLVSKGKEKASLGSVTARECGDALEEIMSNVTVLNEMIKQVATASQEQAIGINEMGNAMRELDHVTQQNSSTTSFVTASANELRLQAESLEGVARELIMIISGAKAAEQLGNKEGSEEHSEDSESAENADLKHQAA